MNAYVHEDAVCVCLCEDACMAVISHSCPDTLLWCAACILASHSCLFSPLSSLPMGVQHFHTVIPHRCIICGRMSVLGLSAGNRFLSGVWRKGSGREQGKTEGEEGQEGAESGQKETSPSGDSTPAPGTCCQGRQHTDTHRAQIHMYNEAGGEGEGHERDCGCCCLSD